jgi:A-factor type gamma-butyrolactone 1'-reductase (1S-forming)
MLTQGFDQTSGMEERGMALIPLQRVAEPCDMAAAAVWPCSNEASYVTGVALPVDGGFTAL